MQRKSFSHMECSIAHAAELLGDGWNLLILRTALLGASRFLDFQERLTISATTLTRRLEALTEHGFLVRHRYETKPPRDAYDLTEMGRDVFPILVAMGTWGSRWLMPSGAPLEFIDTDTQHRVEPVLVDKHSGKEIRPGRLALVPGPGASASLRKAVPSPLLFGANGGQA